MIPDLLTIGMLAGGVGMFLLAVSMITDGLKLAAGSGLRSMLGRWTRSPAHGVFTGFAITAVVQSSSAITVATIGFVNAGLLSLTQALGVVFGANIGTTITGWLVAIIGFEVNISAFSLPLIGLGMVLRLTGGQTRRGAIGTALVGFGLFFIGIQILKDAFEGIVATLDMERYTLQGIGGLLMYLGLGFLMTVLTQSSSAAIAIILTAASGGLLGLYAAGAMVIGANMGTTSTAVLSVIGATPNAKRVAAAHVLFNGITGVIALILLPVMFLVISGITSLLNIEPLPSVTLALFHTVFNVLGVILMLPFTNRLAAMLKGRFASREETLGQPRFLDKNISATPDLALDAIVLELGNLAGLTQQLCIKAIDTDLQRSRDKQVLHDAIARLATRIGEFVMGLQRNALSKQVSTALPEVLACNQYFLNTAELALEMEQASKRLSTIRDPKMGEIQAGFYQEVHTILSMADPESPYLSMTELDEKITSLKNHYNQQKEHSLQRSLELSMPIATVSEIMERNNNTKRMVTQLGKGFRILAELRDLIDTNDHHDNPDSATSTTE